MTRAVGDEASMLKSLTEVVSLFELAQVSVFKLMSSVSFPFPLPGMNDMHKVTNRRQQDSVPKFVRDPKYAVVLQEHDLDLNNSGRSNSPTSTPGVPERSMSRSNRA